MKYMLLVYQDEEGLDEAQREHCYGESVQLALDLNSSGNYLAAAPLQRELSATASVSLDLWHRTVLLKIH